MTKKALWELHKDDLIEVKEDVPSNHKYQSPVKAGTYQIISVEAVSEYIRAHRIESANSASMDYLYPNLYHPTLAEFVTKINPNGRRKKEIEALTEKYKLRGVGGVCGMGSGGTFSGSDPEIFVLSGEGELLPAFTFLPPEKDATASYEKDKTTKNTVYDTYARSQDYPYYDGFQAEFKIEPDTCLGWVVDNVQRGLKSVFEAARQKDPKATLTPASCIPLGEKWLRDGTDEQLALGCAPSQNAYGKFGEVPANPRGLPARFAGFHIHYGLTQDDERKAVPHIVKMLDRLAGVVSVSTLAGIEDPIRRLHYGLAGEYRLPPHGMEYRTLSSSALVHPGHCHLMFNLCRAGLKMTMKALTNLYQGSDEEVQDIINNLDVKGARKLIKRNHDLYCGVLAAIYAMGHEMSDTTRPDWTTDNVVDNFILVGIKEFIDPERMEDYWHIGGNRVWHTHSDGPEGNFKNFSRAISQKFPKPEETVPEKKAA